MPAYSVSCAESLIAVDAPLGNGHYHAVTTDIFTMSNPDSTASRRYPVLAADSLRAHADALPTIAVLVNEQLKLASPLTVQWYGHATASETFTVRSSIGAGFPVGVSEQLRLAPAQSVVWAVQAAEALGLTDALQGKATYHTSVSESFYLSASLAKFLGASVSEVLGFNAAIAVSRKTSGAAAESLMLNAAVTPKLILRVSVRESLRINAAQVVQGLYSPAIAEQLGLAIGYLAPNGSFTTWTTNTRTGAATEYTNYAFNSFAKFGDKYVGASSSGVYELLGPTDAGSAIIAEMKGAYLQFGDTHLSRLKAAYIAARGSGGFVLRIETMDGVTYDYAATTRSGRSSKVHMGKGQRSRYFAYTLTSLGQDFDLDTLEFVPIVLGRRV